MRYTVLLLLLASCADPSVCGPAICAKVRHYTPEQQLNQAAAEDFIRDDSPLVEPLLEWAALRAELKACNGEL